MIVKKTEEQIINSLIEDTINKKLHWYYSDSIIYTRIIKKEKGSRIDVIFKLIEENISNEYFEFSYEYDDLFDIDILSLNIYISKNNKKEIFCKKISNDQNKLLKLMGEVIKVYKKKPKINE